MIQEVESVPFQQHLTESSTYSSAVKAGLDGKSVVSKISCAVKGVDWTVVDVIE